MATKRQKVVVSMEQKLEAIKRLDKGETMQNVADDFGVGRVTVGDWKKTNRNRKMVCIKSYGGCIERKKNYEKM